MKVEFKCTKIMLLIVSIMLMCSVALANESPFSVKADEIEYDMQTGDGTAKGNLELRNDGGLATAKEATFNGKNKSAHLYGGVESVRGDEKLTSNELIVHNENEMSAVGNAFLTKGDKTLNSNRVDYNKATGMMVTSGSTARLTMTDGSVLNAGKITYNSNSGLANATGGVDISSPPRNLTASSDTAVYETNNTGYIELIGNAKATQDGNSVAGNRLRLNNLSGKSEAEGNVRIVYIPKPEDSANLKQPVAGEKPAVKTEVA